MKKFDLSMLTISILLLAIVILGVVEKEEAEKEEANEKAIATVNGQAITTSQLLGEIQSPIQQKVMLSLIEQIAIEQEAEKRGIRIDAAVVSEQLEIRKNSMGGQHFFDQYLKRQKTTEEEIKKRIYFELLANETFLQAIPIKEEEYQAYFNKHRDEFPSGKSYDEVKESVKTKATIQHREQYYKDWLQTLINNADIHFTNQLEYKETVSRGT
ncbi:SurA N-terminal domain-containing protein [Brevibacillus daliensis]|uniref:SurA N-terminal domain-containing protein n=1 Tax=Brevibacillus daliensis TaxID=2892995 RepID=UPI001E600CB2|nr:SurA N-terminal domain-containing protein [Brevibacillus daliensis]